MSVRNPGLDGVLRRWSWWLMLLAVLIAPVVARAAPVPAHVTIEYETSRNGTVMVEVVEKLEHDGKTYKLSSEARGKGLFALARSGSAKRSSQGSITPEGLRPNEYRERRGDRPENVAQFDWQKGMVSLGSDGAMETRPVPERLLDRLCFMWTFAFRPLGTADIRAVLADGRTLDAFRYSIAGHETLKTPAGDIETVRLVKVREPGDERGTEIWLAVRRHFLPVRMLVVEKDGTRLDQIVTRIGA